MGRKILFIVFVVTMVGALFSCNGHLTPSSNQSIANGGLSSNDQALLAKLQPFIGCINRTDSAIQKQSGLYQRAMKVASEYSDPNHKASPDEAAGSPYFSFKIEPYEQHNEMSLACADGLDKAAAMAPATANLDKIGKDYASTLRQLIPLFNQIDPYYQQKDYKDDQFKRGRALDEQVRPLLTHLLSLSAPLREEVEVQNETVQQHRLDNLAKDGKQDFAWYSLNFMFQSRRGLEGFNRAIEKKQLDSANLAGLEKPVQDAFDNAEAYGVAHPGAKDRLGNDPLWYRIKTSAGLYLDAFKQLRRDISNHEQPQMLNRDREQLLSNFNQLVSTYNMLSKLQ